ncbi:hypothetical protein B0J11DRAFT_571835 [Dendryphion nanum]|uniref:Uncharacterized protein n=1 Tax=Dendryphion nanum TaxID=256645 RepID=A0A9P9DBV4_9PLEO|nr:hypothetical protein B0J11DRAFT_571835 [Dendryphion nanum]
MTYSSDVENPRESNPLLGERSSSYTSARVVTKGKFAKFVHFFGGGIFAPDASTYDPIEILLNEQDGEERDRLTERWRDNRLSELSFVGVVAALLAGVLTSTGSWPNITTDAKPWGVRASWYSGIILSLFSILTAADQTVRLHRISSHRDAYKQIRNLLAKSNGKRQKSESGRLKPNMTQIYTWQLPVMFLTFATIAMVVGMFLHVWTAASDLNMADPNAKVAVIFTVIAITTIIVFFAGQASLYAPDNDDLD